MSIEYSKYYVAYSGTTIATTITNKSSIATKWIGKITALYDKNPTVVGIVVGKETEHTSRYGPVTKLATLQLCVDKRCLIFQLRYMDKIPEALKSFLLNPCFTFVGIEACNDVLMLKLRGLECTNIVNILDAAKDRFPKMFERPGLEGFAKLMFGLDVNKTKDGSSIKWEDRSLTDAQVEYASINAYDSYNIGHYLIMEK